MLCHSLRTELHVLKLLCWMSEVHRFMPTQPLSRYARPTGPDGQALPGQGPESLVNQSAQDLLRRLPGVTESNLRPLMAAFASLADLAGASLAELEVAMGSAKNAKALRDFLDAPCPRT